MELQRRSLWGQTLSGALTTTLLLVQGTFPFSVTFPIIIRLARLSIMPDGSPNVGYNYRLLSSFRDSTRGRPILYYQ
ncbi:hypothetical protein V8C35DRAFT_315067 [Trichoderma chlorosporum]